MPYPRQYTAVDANLATPTPSPVPAVGVARDLARLWRRVQPMILGDVPCQPDAPHVVVVPHALATALAVRQVDVVDHLLDDAPRAQQDRLPPRSSGLHGVHERRVDHSLRAAGRPHPFVLVLVLGLSTIVVGARIVLEDVGT